jgi:transcriptional regulator with XRE-family HTH domain
MLREIFREVKRSHGVTGKAISQLTGISQNHISEYINGKRDVTSETLWRMVDAMEQLSKGAAADFGQKLSGVHQGNVLVRHSVNFYKEIQADELAEEIIRLSKALKGALHENPQLQPLSAVRS